MSWALLAIADQVGEDWPKRAREAATALSAGGDGMDEAPPHEQLLADIRDAFADEQIIFTKDLLVKLNSLDESPWGANRRGEGLDARGLGRLLRPFNVRPRDVRTSEEKAKGYRWDQFSDAFARYLPPAATSETSETSPSHSQANVADVANVADTEDPREGLTRGSR